MEGSKTAPSILSLPAEIRLQVFRYLLCESQNIWPQGQAHVKINQLYPAILRTSRQIYQEASHVLYVENTFSFQPANFDRERHEPFNKGLCDKIIRLVRHAVIQFDPYILDFTDKCLSSALNSFSPVLLSPETLRLVFKPVAPWAHYPFRQFENLTIPRVFLEELAAFNVRGSIELCLVTCSLLDSELFEAFAFAAAAKLGWTLRLVECTKILWDNNVERTWRWLLQPEPSSHGTQTKVRQTGMLQEA